MSSYQDTTNKKEQNHGLKREPFTVDELKQLYDLIDMNDNGYLKYDELNDAFLNKFTLEEVHAVLSKLDSNRNGKITFEGIPKEL